MKAPANSHTDRYPALDGIRGFAIIIVMVAHIHNRRMMLFAGAGEFGVWLFFVLSSFLLGLYFYQQPERLSMPIEWANYALRRFLRIYPAFTLTMFAGVALGMWGLGAIPPTLLLQQPTYWAIFVEFKSYFALPLIILSFEFLGRKSFWLPCLLMVAAVSAHYWFFPAGSTVAGYEPWGKTDILFQEYLIVFVIGSFTAWLFVQTPKFRERIRHSQAVDVILLYTALSPLAASPNVLSRVVKVTPVYYHLDWVPWSAAFAVLIYGIIATEGYARKLFELKWLRCFGYISFSMYLFMDFIFDLIEPRVIEPLHFVIACVGLSTAFSAVMFKAIERPLSQISLLRARGSLLSSRYAPETVRRETGWQQS